MRNAVGKLRLSRRLFRVDVGLMDTIEVFARKSYYISALLGAINAQTGKLKEEKDRAVGALG